MNAVSTFKKVITVTVGTAAVALAGSGCTVVTAGVAMPDKSAVDSAIDSSACAEVDAQKVEIPAASSAEPQLRIPQPEGWENSELELDAEVLRFSLVDSKSDAVVIVGLEEVPDMGTEAIFDESYGGMVEVLEEKGLSTDLTMTEGTVCGQPAQTYTSEGSDQSMGAAARGETPAANYLQVVTRTAGRTYLVMMMTLGSDDSPTYQHDAETILTGFEVLPSGSASA